MASTSFTEQLDAFCNEDQGTTLLGGSGAMTIYYFLPPQRYLYRKKFEVTMASPPSGFGWYLVWWYIGPWCSSMHMDNLQSPGVVEIWSLKVGPRAILVSPRGGGEGSSKKWNLRVLLRFPWNFVKWIPPTPEVITQSLGEIPSKLTKLCNFEVWYWCRCGGKGIQLLQTSNFFSFSFHNFATTFEMGLKFCEVKVETNWNILQQIWGQKLQNSLQGTLSKMPHKVGPCGGGRNMPLGHYEKWLK